VASIQSMASCPPVIGLEKVMRAMLEHTERMASEDWRVAPVPWRDPTKEKLKIGWYDHDGMVEPTPGCRRAVREVVKLLEEAGHEVEYWLPPGLPEMMKIFWSMLNADRGHHTARALDVDIQAQCLQFGQTVLRLPAWVRSILGPFVRYKSRNFHAIWDTGAQLSRDLWRENGKKDSLVYQFCRDWNVKKYDVVICPAMAYPACTETLSSRLRLGRGNSYTSVYNVVGCPVGVIPVTKETHQDQERLHSYEDNGDWALTRIKEETLGAVGCPIGVQIVGRHYQEEMVLRAMDILEKLVNKSQIIS